MTTGAAHLRAGMAVACLIVAFAASARAQEPAAQDPAAQEPAVQEPAAPPMITEVRVREEGREITDPTVLSLIETTAGEPFSMVEVRESHAHLIQLKRYDDVQVLREEADGGVRLVYELTPLRPIDRVELRGNTALTKGTLRSMIRERFGASPSATRVPAIGEMLRQRYRDKGYGAATVDTSVVPRTPINRSTLVVTIDAGERSVLRKVNFVTPDDVTAIGLPDLKEGQPYDLDAVRKRLQKYLETMRKNGYYEARADANPNPEFQPDGVHLAVTVRRGPHVRVVFTGDKLTKSEQQRLVPVREDASVDEDVLENSRIAVERYLQERGYREAKAPYMRAEEEGELVITFDVMRGPRYVVGDVAVTGRTAAAISELEVRTTLRIKPEEPFVESVVDAGVYGVGELYKEHGYRAVKVTPTYSPGKPETPVEPIKVGIGIAIDEGTRYVVQSLAFAGNAAMSEAQLRTELKIAEGDPLSQRRMAEGLANIELAYRNLGYPAIDVQPRIELEGDAARLQFTVLEGTQVLIDRVIIDGNQRTSARTIEDELLLKPGDPLGADKKAESEIRLKDLGLFRRARIDEQRHADDDRVDLVVRVEEAPLTSVSYGGGLEISDRLRPVSAGVAEEKLEYVPRGFFQIGRRNLWGKNRSVNLFTRISAKSKDTPTGPGVFESDYGVNEYRVFGTFREPKIGGTPAEALFTGIAERAIRTSYSFITKEARAEVGSKIREIYNVSGRYSMKTSKLFDVDPNLTDEQKPLIDRLFPQVLLSSISGTVLRNTRDSEIDPSSGTFLSANGELAARAIGSEVGYVKTLMQLSWYRQLPTRRRTVLALRGVLGAAHGFPREVFRVAEDPELIPGGVLEPEIVEDLPASERFFAGGSTTHRGFSADRLGNQDTFTPTGFPTGGNGEILLNGELRVSLFSAIAGVAFMDLGNVFKRAADISLFDLRPAVGGGLHYRSPVGPLRVEVGANLDRKELTPGNLERGYVLHVSFGPAF